MADVAFAPPSPSLSQAERVIDAFVAPSKTFSDIARNASWWLPCILIVLTSMLFSVAAIKKVGVPRMSDNLIATMPKIQDMIASAKPADAQAIHQRFEKQITGQFYSAPVVLILSGFVVAGLFLATANFAFGGTATYKGMLAVFWYSILPIMLISLLVSLLLAMNVNVESFRVANPLGTNVGYYLPEGTSPTLVAFASMIDVFSVWILCLQAILRGESCPGDDVQLAQLRQFLRRSLTSPPSSNGTRTHLLWAA